MNKLRHPASGFAAIAALFLMVVLAALGAFMVTFSNTQQLTAAQDVLGTRAYWAARGGVQWGIFSALNGTGAACPAAPTALVTTAPQVSAPFTLDGFSVTVTCTVAGYAERTITPTVPNVFIYTVSAVATQGNSPGATGYIERSYSASVELNAAP